MSTLIFDDFVKSPYAALHFIFSHFDVRVGVDKIIIAEHFVGHSHMMNDDMGRLTANDALQDSTDPTTPIIYSPGLLQVGEVDYPRVDADYLGFQTVVGGLYTFSETVTGPAYVGGTFFNNTLSDCLAANAVSEINDLIAGDNDAIPAAEDNCAGAGTCTSRTIGDPCRVPGSNIPQCGALGYCSMSQEVTNDLRFLGN